MPRAPPPLSERGRPFAAAAAAAAAEASPGKVTVGEVIVGELFKTMCGEACSLSGALGANWCDSIRPLADVGWSASSYVRIGVSQCNSDDVDA
jgi:hypothetical protein